MKRSLFAALVVLLCLAFAAGEQTTYSLELSAAGYLTSTPHSAGDATFVVALGTAAVSSYTTIEIRPINSTTPTTVTRSGAQWTVATSGKLDFSLIGQLGVANGSTTSLAGAMGAKIAYQPGWASTPGLYFVLTGQGIGASSALGGWEPQVSVGIGYQFIGTGSGTLATRRALAKLRGR